MFHLLKFSSKNCSMPIPCIMFYSSIYSKHKKEHGLWRHISVEPLKDCPLLVPHFSQL